MPDYYDLGDYRRTISTSSPDAQLWFDRGLNWTFGFNHEEAVSCFTKALEADPDCPMAYWGIAYAAGPNYNLRWDLMTPPAVAHTVSVTHDAAQKALALSDKASDVERALIQAVQARAPQPVPVEDCSVWNDDYADAMRSVYRDFGDDLDVATLFADALMCRTPWELWDLEKAEPAEGADTAEAQQVLERAFLNPASQQHPGVLHMYIHLMEMSPFPEKALRAADWLRDLVPDAGHLRHMATHIDVLCGQYHDVVDSNHTAILVDRKFLERAGPNNFYTLYRIHDLHFKLYGAMFLGQQAAALDAADELLANIPRVVLLVQEPLPMADFLENFVTVKLHVMVRFGMWQEIIDLPLPDDPDLYCVTLATAHYARGLAFSATGRVTEAEEELRRFEQAVARVPESRMATLTSTSREVLEIGHEMLVGELEYRKGNIDEGFAHLRRSIALYDGLKYAEPWGWMQPVRHAYGALLLEQGRLEEAEAVYRADLGLDDSLARSYQHPENVWSLHGYHEALMRQGKHDFCGIIQQQLGIAAARADVPIESSCFCRIETAA
jgi:tetratricopeptide (TPR) repeat protein